MTMTESVETSASKLIHVLGSEVLANIAGLTDAAVLAGQPVPGRMSRRHNFSRWEAYFEDYLGYKPEGGKEAGHFHLWPELATVLEGRLNVSLGSTVYEVQQGDWLVFRTGVAHAENALSSGKTYRLFWIILLPDGQLGLHQTCYHRRSGYQVLETYHFLDISPQLRHGIQWLASHPWEPLEKARWELLNLVHWCLSGLVNKTLKLVDPCHPQVLKACQILDASLADPPSVKELAMEVGLSPNYLCSLFHRYTGQTVRQYLQKQRLEKAQELLADLSLNIKQIARRLGFRTPQHFTYVFRQTTGLPPGLYRRGLTGAAD